MCMCLCVYVYACKDKVHFRLGYVDYYNFFNLETTLIVKLGLINDMMFGYTCDPQWYNVD